ncbi:GAP1-N1 domain-containing protein [Bombella saccharophila]|uniref:Effector-associated domain EAD1-containing protein n=1 Tax=Bombella saccharophila TaxID=2967338 RepID=A0ABT3W6R6_9PROT|nr:effector-associated domain EAD1-containing protein [Bombella saccharophila]MCX5614074.1 effector-associated domain EAD1-containing protein [Bombella saccharophila]
MRVEQAIYGEVRGGHALRLVSDRSRVPAELASRLDLPDTAPPGVKWSPFVSGFPHGDRYVLARTFADPTASRAGMVLSHAVIAPLREMTTTTDLRPLIALLIAAPKPPDALEGCNVPTSTLAAPTATDLKPAAEALTTRGTGPVVRVGVQGFEDLAVALWFHLWPELRARFAFRLSFGPHDVVDMPQPSLICTPTALAARWTGHRIIGTSGSAPVSRSTAILSGGAEAEPILAFAHEIGARLDRFTDLPLLERAFELGSSSSPSFDDCVAVLRLVERLSPDPTMGTAGKAKLVERLASRLQGAAVADTLLLRNLSTTGLPAASTLWTGLESWAVANKFLQAEDPVMLSAIDDALSATTAVEPWRRAVLAGVVAAARSTSFGFSAAFWRWAETRPATLKALVDHLPQDGGLEARLSDAVPRKISYDAGKAVKGIALMKGWLRLHGSAAGASLSPSEAVRQQLSVDADPGNLDGLRAALRPATPAQSLAIALETADPRILHIAAEEVARKPQLLKDVDFRTLPAQQLWAQALAANAEAWRGPTNPQRSFISVVEKHLDGGTVDPELITALAKSPLADLSGYARRAEVWPRLADPTRTNLLKATAGGWLDRASTGDVAHAPDPQLEAAILAGDRLDSTLRTLVPTGVGTSVRIVSALPRIDEHRFLRWLQTWATARLSLPSGDAEMLGRLILDRCWRRAVDELVHLARMGRDDVKPVLRVCHDMISTFTRWTLGLSAVSYEEKWTVLEDLAADLYPNGPDYNEIWGRAGGRDADLQSFGSGRSRWRDAIGQMRRGGGPRPAQLLDEMRRDFPHSDQVRYLASDPDLGKGYR